MNIITRYIFRIQITAILATLIAIGLVDFALTLLSELTYEVGDHYTNSMAIEYIVLNTPSRLYLYSPYILLIGVIFASGQMMSNLEVTVIESSGMPRVMVILNILVAPLFMAIIFFAIGETLASRLEIQAKEIKDIQAAKDNPGNGIWHKEGDSFFYFSSVDQHGVIQTGFSLTPTSDLSRVERLDFDRIEKAADGLWLITPAGSDDPITDNIEWATGLTTELLIMNSNEDLSLSIGKLFAYNKYLKEQGLSNNQYELKFWQRLTQPLLTVAVLWLGIAFIFGPLRESSMSARIFSAIAIALVFNIAQQILSFIALNLNITAWVISVAPIAFALALAAIILSKKA